jgi:hypothetical protein
VLQGPLSRAEPFNCRPDLPYQLRMQPLRQRPAAQGQTAGNLQAGLSQRDNPNCALLWYLQDPFEAGFRVP